MLKTKAIFEFIVTLILLLLSGNYNISVNVYEQINIYCLFCLLVLFLFINIVN